MPGMKTLFVVTGPTAVGKTDVCIHVARHLGVPIINAVYDIFGTYIPGFLAYCAVALFVLYMILSSINPVDEADL